MNLALTYASRTHHVRLARHISDLIQQRALEGFDSGEEEEEVYDGDYYETNATTDLTNQIAEEDIQYAKNRTERLKQKPDKPVSSLKLTGLKTRAKFDRYMEDIRQGRFLSSTSSRKATNEIQANEDSNHGNETKELFSDRESEGEEGGEMLNGETVGVEDLDTESIGSDARLDTPPLLALESSSATKRPNPFKVRNWTLSPHKPVRNWAVYTVLWQLLVSHFSQMATPVSRRVREDRQTSFLDNITAKVDEEQRRKERREAERGKGSGQGGKGMTVSISLT